MTTAASLCRKAERGLGSGLSVMADYYMAEGRESWWELRHLPAPDVQEGDFAGISAGVAVRILDKRTVLFGLCRNMSRVIARLQRHESQHRSRRQHQDDEQHDRKESRAGLDLSHGFPLLSRS